MGLFVRPAAPGSTQLPQNGCVFPLLSLPLTALPKHPFLSQTLPRTPTGACPRRAHSPPSGDKGPGHCAGVPGLLAFLASCGATDGGARLPGRGPRAERRGTEPVCSDDSVNGKHCLSAQI